MGLAGTKQVAPAGEPGACCGLVLFERVPTTDTCCLWFEVVEGRIGCAGLFVSHKAKRSHPCSPSRWGQHVAVISDVHPKCSHASPHPFIR